MWSGPHTSTRRAGTALLLLALCTASLTGGGCSGSESSRRFPSTPTTDASPRTTGSAGGPGEATEPPATAPPVDPAKVLAAATLAPADLPPGFEARGEAAPAQAGPPPTNAGAACGPFLLANRRLAEAPNLTGPELVATTPDGRVVAKLEARTSVLADGAEAAATVATLSGKDTCVRRAFTSSLARSSPDAELELLPSVPLAVGDGGVRYSGRLTQSGASAQVLVDFFQVGPVVVQVSSVDGDGRLSTIAGIEQALADRIQVALASG